MQQKNILFCGYGDIACRTAARLPDHALVGIARRHKPHPQNLTYWQGAIQDEAILQGLRQRAFDAVVVTLTPAAMSDEGYRQGYIEPLEALLGVWRAQPPGLIVFVSSTAVYGQDAGEWVDEHSPTEPQRYNGQRVLQAEQLLLSSPIKSCILRCAGIYGPGRDFLQRQVRAGKGGSSDYSNRIHVEDCAGAIEHLLQRHFNGQSLAPIYLGCDDAPTPGDEIRAWLAQRLGIDPQSLSPGERSRAGNKRCSNQRLRDSGYHLQYPSFREGYRELLGEG